MNGPEVGAFLTHLAVVGKIAASTQNQARSALLFLYKKVLNQALPWMEGIAPAQRPQHWPVVLTATEVKAVLDHLSGAHRLLARRLYGSGIDEKGIQRAMQQAAHDMGLTKHATPHALRHSF